MPRVSTRNLNKPDVIPTRIQPKRACNRSADPIDPSSSPPSKRVRTETVMDNTEKKSIGRSKRNLPANKVISRHKQEHQPITKTRTKRKRPTLENDLGDDGSHPEDTEATKCRRLDRLVNKAPSPIPDTKTPSWHLPIELFYYIYDSLWDHEHVECYSTATLRSCALTCSRWRDAVRPYIFRFITLDTPGAIERFSHQIRATPEIIQWVRKLRLVGRTLPFIDERPLHCLDAAGDIDGWLYAFPANADTRFPCLRILELFNFAQISPRLEDREAYARWIPELTKLKSVTTLNILRCKMSANNLTAFVRALPSLTRVDLVDVSFVHSNLAVLHEVPTRDSDDEPTGDLTIDGIRTVDEDKETMYPVFYPPPLLQSFRVHNSPDECGDFDFALLRGWFRAGSFAEHLRSLEVSGGVHSDSLHELISALGNAPNLSHIQVPVGADTYDLLESGINLSRLTNLTSIRLLGYNCEWGQEEEVNNIRQFLCQLNAPKLRMIAINSYFEKEEEMNMLASIDQSLADSKFDRLEAIRIELSVYSTLEKRPSQWIRQKVAELLPLAAKRGILIVDFYGWDPQYLSSTSGAYKLFGTWAERVLFRNGGRL
ncbi:hypothetical protein QCA50_017500 [Cerrena zonata]|uniref:F-box domain-containing protein n=1 Tax=Cerrena zonata TaxID=2478898 RepID=A0AAW0FFT5_9APHY